jgi:hypothetical protein
LSALDATQVSGVQLGPPLHRLFWQLHPLPAAEQSVLQTRELPQPSPMVPQYRPPKAGLHATGVQVGPPLHRLFWQVHPLLVQAVPQASELPQPSPMVPQYWSPLAVAQVSAAQPAVGPALHRLSWQVHPVLLHAVPQDIVDPHPSPMSPQY